MRAVWIVVALAGLLSGCAKSPQLRYDLAGLSDVAGACARSATKACDVLALETRPVSAAPHSQPSANPSLAARSWRTIVPRGTVRLVVSIPNQRLYAIRDGSLIATSAVSTGKRGHATPVGFFHIMEKQVHHRSNRYSNAPMPYMQRLTVSGVALHAGHLPGYPASHGCIRMPLGFARRLYGLTSFRSTVIVTKMRIRKSADALRLG